MERLKAILLILDYIILGTASVAGTMALVSWLLYNETSKLLRAWRVNRDHKAWEKFSNFADFHIEAERERENAKK